MRKFTLFVIFGFSAIIGFSCSRNSNLSTGVQPDPVETVLQSAGTALAQQYSMCLIGTGTRGVPCGTLEELSLMFSVYRPLTKEEARCVIVGCVEQFLKIINLDEEIRPDMSVYPFTENNIGLTVCMWAKDGRQLYHPHLSTASLYSGKIHYKTDSPDKPYTYASEEEESYDEALKIVQQRPCAK